MDLAVRGGAEIAMATARKTQRNTPLPPTAAVGASYRNVSMRPYGDQDRRLAELTISDVHYDGGSLRFDVPTFHLEGHAYAEFGNEINLLFNNVSPIDPLAGIADAVFSLLTKKYGSKLARLCHSGERSPRGASSGSIESENLGDLCALPLQLPDDRVKEVPGTPAKEVSNG